MAAKTNQRKGHQKMRVDAKLDALPARLLSHFLQTRLCHNASSAESQFLDPSIPQTSLVRPELPMTHTSPSQLPVAKTLNCPKKHNTPRPQLAHENFRSEDINGTFQNASTKSSTVHGSCPRILSTDLVHRTCSRILSTDLVRGQIDTRSR